MAVSTYPELGGDLFNEAIFESLVKDGKSLYAKVAPWPFSSGDKLRSNVGFMSLPGGAAFLYYSGSFFVVFFGAFVVAFLVQFSEIFVYALTRNPILCASYGWAVAVWFAHFGGTPRAQLPTVLFLFSLIALFGLIQAKWLGSLVVLVRRIMSLD